MELLSIGLNKEKALLYEWANALALITIFYNIIEGLVSIYFGVEDETLALFGFGLDSFVGNSSALNFRYRGKIRI